MKRKMSMMQRALLAATMLVSPSVAVAQQNPPQEETPPVAAEDSEAVATEETEIVVQGRFIPEPMRETSEVSSFLSSADLARTGDDNAASALTRLTGLSVVSDRFVFVRGLGDRYSSALLNGSPLPSPEPLRRQVPLDLFPSNILSGATVQKTFSPNYPGEFGGGIIDLKTLRLPNEPFVTVKLGTGGNTESTGKDGIFYYGSRTDWAGVDDNVRDVPDVIAGALGRRARLDDSNFTQAELEAFGESLVNSPLTVIQSGDRPLDFEGEITAGTSIDIGEYNIGLVGVFGFDQQWRTREARKTEVVGNAIQTDGVSTTTTNDVVANFFGSAALSVGDHELTLSTMFVRSTTKYAQIEVGLNFDLPGADPLNPVPNERSEETAWYERQLGSIQLAGEHDFDDLGLALEWRTAYAQSTRDAPYERNVRYDIIGGVPTFGGGGGLGNGVRFSELKDEVISAGVDATYTVPLSDTRDLTLSAGAAYSNTTRTSELFQFAFTGPRGPTPIDVLRARIDFLFSPDNIGPTRFVLNETTGRDDSYKGRLTQHAFYVMADAEIIPLLRASLGFRFEDASQAVRTFNRFGEASTRPVSLDNSYWLPAATLTWNFAEDMQVRLGYSQTIARPQFRELAFTPFLDPDSDLVYQGNPTLQDSEFRNYDARLEYYFGRNQFVTAGLFYKTIDKPIEEVIFRTNRFEARFINAPEAVLFGTELEFRTQFEMPFEVPFLTAPEWLFSVNYTYTKSEVNAPAGTTVINPNTFLPSPSSEFGLDGSPLQGTPEHIANLQFGYQTDDQQLTLLVGWVDERVLRRGLGSTLPVYEDPGMNVDLVFKQDFKIGVQDFTLGLSARNILGEDYEEYQRYPRGRNEVNSYERGQSVSVSLTAKY